MPCCCAREFLLYQRRREGELLGGGSGRGGGQGQNMGPVDVVEDIADALLDELLDQQAHGGWRAEGVGAWVQAPGWQEARRALLCSPLVPECSAGCSRGLAKSGNA